MRCVHAQCSASENNTNGTGYANHEGGWLSYFATCYGIDGLGQRAVPRLRPQLFF